LCHIDCICTVTVGFEAVIQCRRLAFINIDRVITIECGLGKRSFVLQAVTAVVQGDLNTGPIRLAIIVEGEFSVVCQFITLNATIVGAGESINGRDQCFDGNFRVRCTVLTNVDVEVLIHHGVLIDILIRGKCSAIAIEAFGFGQVHARNEVFSRRIPCGLFRQGITNDDVSIQGEVIMVEVPILSLTIPLGQICTEGVGDLLRWLNGATWSG